MGDKSEEEEPTIAEDIVVTKYKMAGEIVNKLLKDILKRCTVAASVREICEWGDKQLMEETSKVFKKEKEIKKGIAFPTCISVNNCVCHFSPLENEPDVILEDGDVVKIDLGAHIDGFSAVVAHTIVVGATRDQKVKGRRADVILAANNASEAALRLLRPGNTNNQVTEIVSKIAEQFECKPVEGMLSHKLERNRIDGGKSIIQNPTEAQRKEHEKADFDLHEVYGLDVLISTGDGVGRELESKTNVFKKTDETYMLKMKASRAFYSDVDKRFGMMPFNVRLLEDEKKARMGLMECLKHKLIDPFQVLYERKGEFVAQFKSTVLLMPNGPHKITGLPFEADLYESEHKIKDSELQAVLRQPVNEKNTKRNKKKKGKPIGGKGDEEAELDEPKGDEEAEPDETES